MKPGASDELYFGSLRNIKIMIYVCMNCSYIVSFVVKSPSGGKNPWKTADVNPRMSIFEKCFKSWFDTVRWWEMSCAFDFFRNYWFRCFLRRVMVILLQQKNFGLNVIYFVLGTLVIVARLTYSCPKHCLLLQDWQIQTDIKSDMENNKQYIYTK